MVNPTIESQTETNRNNEQLLVTGGAGFIGSHLVDALLEKGSKVRVLDNLDPQVHGKLSETGSPPDYLNKEAEFIHGDVRNPEIVSKALQGIDVVFHQAAKVGVGQSMYAINEYTSANALGTAVLLQAIVDMKIRPRKLVVASSMSIYGEGAYRCPEHGLVFPKIRPVKQLEKREWEVNCPVDGCKLVTTPVPTTEEKPLQPTSIYAINKRDHEEMFLVTGRAYNIPTVALRYFNTYGTRQALSNPYTGVAAIFSNRILNRKSPVIYEDGLQRRDFTHVSDIVQANLLVMDHPDAEDKVYNVGTGLPTTILGVAEALIGYFELPDEFRPVVTGQFRAGDIRHCTADISRIKALGYSPKVRFEDGIADLVEWVRKQSDLRTWNLFDQAQEELSRRGLTA